jgi:integrase
MPKISFIPTKIKSLKPKSRSVEYFDADRKQGQGAFGIRVSPKGKMVWFIMYKNKFGKIKRHSIGEYPDLSLSKARVKANDTMAQVNDGKDPMSERKDYRKAPLMGDLWDEYELSLNRKDKKKADSTLYEEKRRWENIIKPAIGKEKVKDVTPAMLADLLDNIADKAPVSANRLHSLLSVMFRPALRYGWIEVHPLQWIEKPGGSETPRKRVLTDDEIKEIWPHLDKLRPNPRDILRLILLTAQRPGEIMSMRWEDIDMDNATWTQQTNKTDVTHVVPLSDPVLQILKAREKKSEWVFPSTYNRAKGAKTGHAMNTKNARAKVKTWSGIKDWTAHDLRRTARTIMSRLQIKQHIRERILNHSQGGMQGVYDQFDYLEEKRNALEKLGREIQRIIGIKKKGQLIKMRAMNP